MEDALTRGGDLDRVATASRDEIGATQLDLMKWSLRHACENLPSYRRRFDATGVHPDDLKSLADLAKLPFTTKQDLRDSQPFGMFTVPREQLLRIHGWSGSTGEPTVVGYTRKDIDTWADQVARSIDPAGARPGDMVHVAYRCGVFTGGLGAHCGAERLG